MQQRRGTASQWTSANPVLNAGEMGWESDTNKFKIGDGTNHWADLDYFTDINSTTNPSFGTSIVFEGATADSYETTLQVTDPTADRTLTLPNSTGTVATQEYVDGAVAGATITPSELAGSGITWNVGNEQFDVNTTTIQARVADVSDTEIGYLNGVTSAIQTQLNSKQATVSGVDDTEIGYLNGVTSAIQTQLDDKLPKSGGTMTGAIAMGTSKITGLGTPTADTDAATKAYVDAATAGLNVHAAVQAATTADITLSSALENGDVLDGVTLATGNRVLVKNQTTKTENGVYVVKASGAPDRADDYNTAGEVDAGDFIFVEAGTANSKTGWVQTNVITTVGSDNIEFTQFSGAGTYAAGTGLTLTGNTFSINTGTTVDLSTAQTLTNKTIDGSNNTISNVAISTAVSGLGTGIATFLGTPSSANLISAITDETGSGALVFGTAPTLTNALEINPILRGPEERWAVSATAATGTIPLDTITSGILYYTSNATANWTLNIRGNSGTTLNDALATNDSITVVFFATNGATPYYQTGFQIDGSAITPKWQNGSAPSAGNANSIDIYSYTIVKTGNAAFAAFGSQTRFA